MIALSHINFMGSLAMLMLYELSTFLNKWRLYFNPKIGDCD